VSKKSTLALLLLSAVVCFLPGAVRAADLTVTVAGLESDDGNVHIALYSDPAGFPKSDGMLSEVRAKPKDRQATWVFKNLAAGTFAIAVFHDANGNGSFDQGAFKIPLEDYGFSMGARAFFSAPDFDEAAFPLPEEGRTIVIDLGN
tara:strand:+ start:21 stop:458 length:438 start_codon:yes stop_codon:yes gene_type:complete